MEALDHAWKDVHFLVYVTIAGSTRVRLVVGLGVSFISAESMEKPRHGPLLPGRRTNPRLTF